MRFAVSSAVPRRPAGVARMHDARIASSIQPVSTPPGLITLARTPRSASSNGGSDDDAVERSFACPVRQVVDGVVAGERDDPPAGRACWDVRELLSERLDEQPRGPAVHREVTVPAGQVGRENGAVHRLAVGHNQGAHGAESLCRRADQFGWDDWITQVPGYKFHVYAEGPARIGDRFRILGVSLVAKPVVVRPPKVQSQMPAVTRKALGNPRSD